MNACELSQLIINLFPPANLIRANEPKTEQKMDRDDVLVKLVEVEDIIWRRNHPQFKNVVMKEQAWGRIALQLGISSESQAQTHTDVAKSFPISSHRFLFSFPSSDMCEMTFCVNPITNSYICTRKTNFPSNSFAAVCYTKRSVY